MIPRPDRRRWLLASLATPLAAALPACGGGEDAPDEPAPRFSRDGLQGRTVRRLRPSGFGLLAATDRGVHLRHEGTWMLLGLADLDVQDIAPVSRQHLLAIGNSGTERVQRGRLVETRDGGASWQAVAHDFGGSARTEPLHALVHDGAGGRLLATGATAVAESTDHGRHWRRLAGEWQGFAGTQDALAFDPVLGDAWFGGQDAIEGFVLYRAGARDAGVHAHPGLMPSPSSAKGIRFVMGEPRRVLVCGEGGIVHTRDGGAQWQTLLQRDHRFYFDVLQDVQRPRRLVTAGWDKHDGPQPLRVEISDDDGATWRTLPPPDAVPFGGVWSLALALEEGRSVGYFGLYQGGVVRLELG